MSTSSVPPALFTTINDLRGMDEVIYCEKTHSFFGGEMHCTVPFAMSEFRIQPSIGQSAFGRTATYRIPKTGDLVHWTYAVIVLPGLKGKEGTGGDICSQVPTYDSGCADYVRRDGQDYIADQKASQFLCNYGINGEKAKWFFDQGTDEAAQAGPTAQWGRRTADQAAPDAGVPLTDESTFFKLPSNMRHWGAYINGVGQRIIREARFRIGSQSVAELRSDFLFAREELAGRPGKRLDEMVGRRVGDLAGDVLDHLILDSLQTRFLYVPLPFFWTRAPAHALSLIHLALAPLEVEIKFASLGEILIRSNENTVIHKWNDTPLRDEDLNCVLSTTHIYLPESERERMTTHGNEKMQIIQQVQYFESQLTQTTNSVDLGFNLPTLELMFVVRRQCHEQVNDWFNYSGIGGLDIVESMGLRVNSTPLVNPHEGAYYRLVQPYQFHRLLPRAHIYTHSFALFPEEMLISGSLNFSRFEHATMQLNLQHGSVSGDEPGYLLVMAPCWNVLLMQGGGGTVTFA